MIFAAEAPSNIALIKYMGKNPSQNDTNRPTNASLSYTLNHLRSRVEIESIDANDDQWEPLESSGWQELSLSEKGRAKFLSHFQFLKKHWNIEGHFILRSANNFPAGAGVASSASSFAALTLATFELAKEKGRSVVEQVKDLADLSRRGSGSSGRSLFDRYSLWDLEGFHSLGQKWPELKHELIVVDESHKSVTSSEAHLKVLESPLFAGRIERVELSMKNLLQAFESNDYQAIAKICRDELWDMHSLFHTSNPPFYYMNDKTIQALSRITNFCNQYEWPIVTMDAGANIHLLFFPHQDKLREDLMAKLSDFEFFN